MGKLQEESKSTEATATAAKTLLPSDIGTDWTFKREIVWKNVFYMILIHLAFFYGVSLMPQCKWQTHLWSFFMLFITGESITAGVHRCFSHKSYKANSALKTLYVIGQTMAGQNSIYIWARDHRQHHKYSDTDADPHNATRGLFFSHMGWLMSRKHPLVKEKGRQIDMSDLEADPLIMFQYRNYFACFFLLSFLIPTYIPVYFWGETFNNSLFGCNFVRYVFLLHNTWLTNSIAHYVGHKPYDKAIRPVECYLFCTGAGEQWHNFHHTFPYDYKAAEFWRWNLTTKFIELMAHLGLAYDLRTTPKEQVLKRVDRTGDGTYPVLCEKQAKDFEKLHHDD